MTAHLGGCACGAIRYRLEDHDDAGYCHCERCRKTSGGPVAAWALARASALRIETGSPAEWQNRWFCSTCGSQLFRVDGERVWLGLGTLDEANAIEPRIHRCFAEQLRWLRLHDLLPHVDGATLQPIAERLYLRGATNPDITRASAVTLRDITSENVRAVLFADVAANQRRFVAPNSVSLAQAYLAGDVWHRAIYADDTVVGFVMAERLLEDELDLPMKGDPDLWRFMVDDRYQGLGFGGRALELTLAELRTWEGARNIWLSCVRGAGSPYELYRRFGFQDTGKASEGEVVMRLPLQPATSG